MLSEQERSHLRKLFDELLRKNACDGHDLGAEGLKVFGGGGSDEDAVVEPAEMKRKGLHPGRITEIEIGVGITWHGDQLREADVELRIGETGQIGLHGAHGLLVDG